LHEEIGPLMRCHCANGPSPGWVFVAHMADGRIFWKLCCDCGGTLVADEADEESIVDRMLDVMRSRGLMVLRKIENDD
jgi:hypothetical protein